MPDTSYEFGVGQIHIKTYVGTGPMEDVRDTARASNPTDVAPPQRPWWFFTTLADPQYPELNGVIFWIGNKGYAPYRTGWLWNATENQAYIDPNDPDMQA